jgi:hypothetical protein
MTYKISEFDGFTGKTILRDMTPEEIAQHEADNVKRAERAAAAETEKQTKATAKAALLERLGITAEEATLLLS